MDWDESEERWKKFCCPAYQRSLQDNCEGRCLKYGLPVSRSSGTILSGSKRKTPLLPLSHLSVAKNSDPAEIPLPLLEAQRRVAAYFG